MKERESKVRDNADLLSLFLSNPEEFTDEVIVDEILDFFVAGAQTTQLTTLWFINLENQRQQYSLGLKHSRTKSRSVQRQSNEIRRLKS